MSIKKLALAVATGLFVALGAAPAGAQAELKTYVSAISGISNESAGAPVGAVRDNFYNVNPLPVYVPLSAIDDPTQIAATGLQGGYRVTTSAAATVLSDATAVTDGQSFGDQGAYSFTGSSSATAAYGQLRAAAQGTHSYLFAPDFRPGSGAAAFSKFTERFTVNSPNVTPLSNGTMRIAVTIDGSWTVTNSGYATIDLWSSYGANHQANNLLLTAGGDIDPLGYELNGPHSSYGSFTPPPGMALTVGPRNANNVPTSLSFGGTGTVYADVPIQFSSGQDFTLGLLATVGAMNGVGSESSRFEHTATISGIQIFDSGGQAVPDFTISSGSGTPYDANGVQLGATAPEPATFALFALGLPVAWVRRRKW